MDLIYPWVLLGMWHGVSKLSLSFHMAWQTWNRVQMWMEAGASSPSFWLLKYLSMGHSPQHARAALPHCCLRADLLPVCLGVGGMRALMSSHNPASLLLSLPCLWYGDMGQVAEPDVSIAAESAAPCAPSAQTVCLFAFSGFGTMSPLSTFPLLLTQAAPPVQCVSAAVTILCWAE